jgi:hypothetical protein
MDEKPQTDVCVWQPTERQIRGSIYTMWATMAIVIVISEVAIPWSWPLMVPLAQFVGVRAQRFIRNPDPD